MSSTVKWAVRRQQWNSRSWVSEIGLQQGEKGLRPWEVVTETSFHENLPWVKEGS